MNKKHKISGKLLSQCSLADLEHEYAVGTNIDAVEPFEGDDADRLAAIDKEVSARLAVIAPGKNGLSLPIQIATPWHCDEDGLVTGKESQAHLSGPSVDIFDASEWPVALHDEAMGTARIMTAAVNAFDSAARRLAINAVELSERMADGGIAELLEALDYLLEQTVDMDLKYGILLTEGEEDARAKALAIIAKAKGGAA